MAQTVNVNFKLDADVKKKMEKACNDMGLSMSAAFTIFAKKVGTERRIPFEITADPFYEEEHIAMLERRIADLRALKNAHEHDLIEVD
ncbi:MAG: type II toxin-antitoxin system RelB/DinJ family antitoxin [Clostridia bacterium]|nr:type II toxin-antitoxin system RelB/DinJ family antitoxin [Clostridiales bacterium]MCR5802825.1 type II toxin-antitoxin system RelB/DinJ family antitoxin [Clostridia bacterium]